eukprot:15448313-Alexandrium_andersonii.AAC.1
MELAEQQAPKNRSSPFCTLPGRVTARRRGARRRLSRSANLLRAPCRPEVTRLGTVQNSKIPFCRLR